jgi:hypothetical protein
MKKATTKRNLNPGAASLREMPEVDFSRYRIRKNPYASRIAREGVEIVHHEPSKNSLAEMPEANFAKSQVRRNKYAMQAITAASKVQYGKGRPPKGSEVGPTPARSIRLPKAVWKDLENEARARATTVHALLREVVLAHLSRPR